MAYEEVRKAIEDGKLPVDRATLIDEIYQNLTLAGSPLPSYDTLRRRTDSYLEEMAVATGNYVRLHEERLRYQPRERLRRVKFSADDLETILGHEVTTEYAEKSLGLKLR